MSSGRAGPPQRRLVDDKWMEELRTFYDAYGSALYGYLFALLCSPEEAEDALQELFARLLSKRRKYSQLRNAEAYLFRAARNEAFSRLRRRNVRERAGEVLSQQASLLNPASGEEIEREDVDRVNAALQELPTKQREVVVLKIFHGMTFREIGTVVRASPNTAASRYRYALDKLKLLLGDER